MDRDVAPLPAPVSPIIGRELETEQAVRLLREESVRLLTLTGTGGVGKTRLALEIARRAEAAFDAVSFLSLAHVRTTSALPSQIASALGLPDSAEPVLALRGMLRQRRLLLILDNLEQIPNAGLALSPFLQAIPGLSMLITSRTRLAIAGEHVLPVEPLPTPAQHESDKATIAADPSVRLLLASARASNVGYACPLDQLATAAEIVRRLDGLPLALELAGARLPFLGPVTLLREFESALPLLTGGPRDQPARLQTMRDAIAWSYDLLAVEERALFRRLSVFSGGFTLEMAEAMVRGWQPEDGYPYFFGIPTPIAWMDVGRDGPDLESEHWSPVTLEPVPIVPITGLESLERHNLIRAVRSDSGIERFQMFETVREFGLEQLERSQERAAAEHARAVLMTGIAEVSAMALWGDAWRPAATWMEAELPNLRAALAWLQTQPEEANQLALRMVESLWPFWQSRGFVREGCVHVEACLARPGGRPALRAQALNMLAALSWIRNDLTRAESVLDEALPELERIDFLSGQGRNFMVRALIAWSHRDYERMEKMALIGKDRFIRADDWLGPAICWLLIGISSRMLGDRERAMSAFTECHQECLENRGGSFTWGMAIAQYFLGEMAREEGDRASAVSNIRAALDAFVDLGDPWTVGGCVGTLATYLVADGELEEAARLLGASHELESSYGVFLPPTETEMHQAAAIDLRQRIGPDDFTRLFAEGARFSMEEAAARAMAVPMESVEARAARLSGGQPHPLLERLSQAQVRTLRMLMDNLNVKQIALVERRSGSSIYERIDRIKEALGLPPETTIMALVRFVESQRIL